MNFSKQTSQFDACLNDHGRMPEWKTAYLTTPVTASMISLSVVNLLVSPCMYYIFKCLSNDCGQNISKNGKQLPHFAGLFSFH